MAKEKVVKKVAAAKVCVVKKAPKVCIDPSKTICECGGYYTNHTYKGCYTMFDPQESHEKTKMHQKYLETGEKTVKALPLDPNKQGCGCGGSYSTKIYHPRYGDPQTKHETSKMHQEWVAGGCE